MEDATKPQQQLHAKSSPTAEEGVADASGSSLACLADLAVHKTVDLDTTANFESKGQAQKVTSDISPEGRPEQNDQSNSSEAIEDPQEVTLVQESAAEGTAITTEVKDPVVASDETVSSEKTPSKEVSVSDGVPVITGDTDVNNRSGHQLIFFCWDFAIKDQCEKCHMIKVCSVSCFCLWCCGTFVPSTIHLTLSLYL